MLSEPIVAYFAERPYVAIHKQVDMRDIPSVLPPLIFEIRRWLKKNHIAPAGPPFFQYLSMDKNYSMQVAVGFPVAQTVKDDGHITGGAFPAGTYATVTYSGGYENLKDAHMFMESWIKEKGLQEKQRHTATGIEWGSRIEFYITDHREEPNPEKWKTDVVFLLT